MWLTKKKCVSLSFYISNKSEVREKVVSHEKILMSYKYTVDAGIFKG